MDRFNYNQIFEKLREINYLVNTKPSAKTIRFFYLLRDDIFTSKDRAKFFDFIIPVVPVIDSSNSYDKFVEQFKKTEILRDFHKEFLQGISLYIDDMRILKNICTEYIVYYHRIQSTELDCNKLLAIIVYKNLFPKDFSDLQLNRGFVYSLFSQKESLIKDKVNELEAKIDNNNELIAETEREHCNNIDELDFLFLPPNYFNNLTINGQGIGHFKSNIELIQAVKKADKSSVLQNGRYLDAQANLSEWSKKNNDSEYIKRKNFIDLKKEEKTESIQNHTRELRKQIESLKGKLHRVLSRYTGAD
jgi:hypothetical protein